MKQISIQLRGRVGPVIISLRHGKYYARLAPGKVKQAPVTKRYSSNFGLAAMVGSIVRAQLDAALPFPKQKLVQSRFAGRITSWLGQQDIPSLPAQTNLPFISGFSFNEKASLTAGCRLPLQVTQTGVRSLAVQLPAFVPVQAFKAPKGTVAVECIFAAGTCKLLKPGVADTETSFTLRVPYNDTELPAQTISLLLPETAGCLLVTALRLSFINGNGIQMIQPAFMPAGVIDARYCAV